MTTTLAQTWEAPGPGQWTASTDHYHRPLTPIMRDLVGQTFSEGFRRTFREFGVPLDTLAMAFVNGYGFVRPVPIIDKPGSKPPPKPILALACLLHPELRRRSKAAKELVTTDGWRHRASQWWDHEREAYRYRNRQLQAIDVTALDQVALLAHLDETIAHLRDGLLTHFEIAPIEAAPFGLLCVRCEAWGIGAEELLDVLVGASPATSAPSHDLEPLRAELRAHNCEPATLDDVRSCSTRAVSLFDEWMHDRQWLITTGYDLDDKTLGELPHLVLAAISAPAPPPTHPDPGGRFRDRIPIDHWPEFDNLVAGARQAFALRDDNGPLTAEWPTGLVRRSLLEVGRRAADRGILDDAQSATSATRLEAGALLTNDVPAATSVSARHSQRRAADLDEVPTVLGDPEPPPPPGTLPGALDTIARCATVIINLELAAERRLATLSTDVEHGVLHGVGIGENIVRGRARVARTPDDLDDLVAGDIIVTPATAPTWNLVLASAAGLVVEEGGLTGHAAIVAREFGLPTVIGVKRASSTIVDGSEIELDTVAGEVRFVAHDQ